MLKLQLGEVARDRGRVALAPSRMVQQRIVDPTQPQREPDEAERGDASHHHRRSLRRSNEMSNIC